MRLPDDLVADVMAFLEEEFAPGEDDEVSLDDHQALVRAHELIGRLWGAVLAATAAEARSARDVHRDADLPLIPMRHEYPAGAVDDQLYHEAMVAWVRAVVGRGSGG